MRSTYIIRTVILLGMIFILVDLGFFLKGDFHTGINDYFRIIDWSCFGYSLYQVFQLSRYRLPDQMMNKLTVRLVAFTLIYFLFIFVFKSYAVPAGVFIGHILILRNELKGIG